MIKKIEYITTGIFILLLILVAGLFLGSLVPIPGNIKIKIVKSGSMEPTIMTGSIVIIKPEASYNINDVITFGEDSKLAIPTTHRIIKSRIEAGVTYFTTKGDANKKEDTQETNSTNVIGKVAFSLPYVGYMLDFARKPFGFIFLIIIPASLLIVNELIAVWRESKKLYRDRKAKNAGNQNL